MPSLGILFGLLIFAGQIISAPRFFAEPDSLSSTGVQLIYSPINLLQDKGVSGTNFIEGNRSELTGWVNETDYAFKASMGHSNYNTEAVDRLYDVRLNFYSNTSFANISGRYRFSFIELKTEIEAVQTRSRTAANSTTFIGIIFPQYYIKEISLGYIEHSLPFHFDGRYTTASLRMDDHVHRYGFTPSISLGTDLFYLDYRYSRTFLSPKATGEQVTSLPYGKLTLNEGSLNYKSKQYTFALDNISCRFNTRTYFYQQDIQFAYLFVPEFFFEKYGLTAAYRQSTNSSYATSVNYARFKLKMLGELDSWPFIDVLESIAVRAIYFRGYGTFVADWMTFSYNYKNNCWSINPSVTYIDIRPEFHLDSWESSAFIFGVTSMTHSIIDIRRAGFAFINIKAAYYLWDITIGAEANQFVPLFVNRSPVAPTLGSGGESTSATASGNKSTDGGRWFKFFIKKAF